MTRNCFHKYRWLDFFLKNSSKIELDEATYTTALVSIHNVTFKLENYVYDDKRYMARKVKDKLCHFL